MAGLGGRSDLPVLLRAALLSMLQDKGFGEEAGVRPSLRDLGGEHEIPNRARGLASVAGFGG